MNSLYNIIILHYYFNQTKQKTIKLNKKHDKDFDYLDTQCHILIVREHIFFNNLFMVKNINNKSRLNK